MLFDASIPIMRALICNQFSLTIETVSPAASTEYVVQSAISHGLESKYLINI